LKSHGVEVIFCITGAGNLAIVDAIHRDGAIKIVYSHHEQAAVMEAQGYSRLSGKLGVALVTTGGGSSNVVTGVLSAYLDSIPILIITGNESSFHCENRAGLRAYGVQGFDSVSVLKPITKKTLRIMESAHISSAILSAISTAVSPRKGPAHIDFPMDLQRKFVSEQRIQIEDYQDAVPLEISQSRRDYVSRLIKMVSQCKKPVIYVGDGCRSHLSEVEYFIRKVQIPYFVSWSAIDLFPESDPLNIGRLGIYGDRAANIILQQSDLLLTLGTRLAIPQIGYDRADFARNAAKWVVEIDKAECTKFEDLEWNVLNCSVEDFLIEVSSQLEDLEKIRVARPEWDHTIKRIWAELPRLEQIGTRPSLNSGYVHSADAIALISKKLKEDAVVITDVGAGLLTGHYIYEKRGTQRFFTSQGLGEMGFGLPAAIGAFFAEPRRQLVCLNTDGAVMFNLQELQLLSEHQIPLKLFIFNNGGYAMIKISQQNLFNSRITGSSVESGISFPSFEKVADTFGMKYLKVTNLSSFEESLNKNLESQTAVLFDVIMDPQQKYFPRLATSKLPDGTLISPPLEDLDPLISLDKLEKLMNGKIHANSILARG